MGQGRAAHLQAPRQKRGFLVRRVAEGQDLGPALKVIWVEERGDDLRRLPLDRDIGARERIEAAGQAIFWLRSALTLIWFRVCVWLRRLLPMPE